MVGTTYCWVAAFIYKDFSGRDNETHCQFAPFIHTLIVPFAESDNDVVDDHHTYMSFSGASWVPGFEGQFEARTRINLQSLEDPVW